MGVVADALTAALLAGAREPTTLDVLEDVQTRQTLARAEAGIDSGPLPRQGTPQRRTYASAMRRYQRYVTSAGETRRPVGERVARVLRAARGQLADPQVARARLNGIYMRLVASIKVSQVFKVHAMPADAGGRPRFQHVDGTLMTPALNAWQAGDMVTAEDETLRAFYTAYWGNPTPAETGEVESCAIRM